MSCSKCDTEPCHCGYDYVSLSEDKLDNLIERLRQIKRIKTNKVKRNNPTDTVISSAHSRYNLSEYVELLEDNGFNDKYSEEQLNTLAQELKSRGNYIEVEYTFDASTMKIISAKLAES